MPEANAESTLKNSMITTILNILIKTTSFRSEHQLCEVRTEKQNKKIFSFFKKTKTGAENDEISKEIFLFWLRRSEVKALGRLGLLRTWGVVLRLKIPRARRVNRTLTRNRFEQRQLQADTIKKQHSKVLFFNCVPINCAEGGDRTRIPFETRF